MRRPRSRSARSWSTSSVPVCSGCSSSSWPGDRSSPATAPARPAARHRVPRRVHDLQRAGGRQRPARPPGRDRSSARVRRRNAPARRRRHLAGDRRGPRPPGQPMIVIMLTALAGGFGAAARFALDTALTARVRDGWVRLMVINVSGSALLGLTAGLGASRLLAPDVQLVLGAGFVGGYTTFSAASLATVRLVEERRWAASLALEPRHAARLRHGRRHRARCRPRPLAWSPWPDRSCWTSTPAPTTRWPSCTPSATPTSTCSASAVWPATPASTRSSPTP